MFKNEIKHPKTTENSTRTVWAHYNNYRPSIIAFFRASRGRIWTKIGGNESQRLPGPPYPPQNRRFCPENLKNR